jgi:hypothetical protein
LKPIGEGILLSQRTALERALERMFKNFYYLWKVVKELR